MEQSFYKRVQVSFVLCTINSMNIPAARLTQFYYNKTQVTHQGEENCCWANMVVNKAQFQMFSEEGNAFNKFVRLRGHTQCILGSDPERKHNFFAFKWKLQRAPLSLWPRLVTDQPVVACQSLNSGCWWQFEECSHTPWRRDSHSHVYY